MKMNGTDLLTAFKSTGSEEAFRELMSRYTNLVFSAAKRRLFSTALAEEVSQTVFVRLANAVPKLKTDAELVAWLHRTTVHVAIDLWRSETRRRTREQHAAVMEPAHTENAVWEEMSPVLDEALNHLNDADRQALLLRFFDEKTMREVGGIIGVSEDAAKMRVSRAMDRLRTQLIGRGVTCSLLALGAALAERSIEEAPSQLVAGLRSMKLPIVASVGGMIGIWNTILLLFKSKVTTVITATAFLIVVGIMIFDSAPTDDTTDALRTASTNASSENKNSAVDRFLDRRTARRSAAIELQPSAKGRMMFRVLDAETGMGLPNAKIQVAYFYAGGRPEGHDLVTDETGTAAIPEARESGDRGMNVFVVIEGYVPKAVGLGTNDSPEYVIKLNPAAAVGGTVIDEQGARVQGVRIEASRNEPIDSYKKGDPNTDFQTVKMLTDTHGRWFYHYIPKNYETVNFHLTHKDYAVTSVSVPMNKSESMLNTTMTIKRGFVVVGRVSDLQGKPIAGATIRELPQYGSRTLSSKTDSKGMYSLIGVSSSDPSKPYADIVVQAEGMAPQLQSVQLSEPTNTVNFSLAKGNLFRGRVLDETGNPISKAVVRTDFDFQNQIDSGFKWFAETDTDGHFEWISAPAEPICYWFEADGFKVIRGRPLLADGSEHEIKLTRKTSN